MAGRIVREHAALQKWLREWYGAWENIQDELEELIDAGHEVISVMTQHGSGRGSGVEVADRLATIWTICDGQIIRRRGSRPGTSPPSRRASGVDDVPGEHRTGQSCVGGGSDATKARLRDDHALYHPEHVFVPVVVGKVEAKGVAGYKAWLKESKEIMPWAIQEFEGAVEIATRSRTGADHDGLSRRLQRDRNLPADVAPHHRRRGKDHADRGLPRSRRRSRRRWVSGVGDVAGERGGSRDARPLRSLALRALRLPRALGAASAPE